MRIIAGTFRGRRLRAPPRTRMRPTADLVREAWFNILGTRVAEARVLDLFAGCGTLGLEALSRGAQYIEFVEIARVGITALRQNVATLGVSDRVTIHRADALRFVRGLAPLAFDLALADPPYGTGQATKLIDAFRMNPFARILAVEHRIGDGVAGDETRHYGDSALTFCHAP